MNDHPHSATPKETKQPAEHVAVTPVNDSAPNGASRSMISDKQFIGDLEQLKALRSYMIRRAAIAEAATIDFGDLNILRFDKKGRMPTKDEWSHLEDRSIALYKNLPDIDRRRFLYGQVADLVIRLSAILGTAALVALVVAVGTIVFTGRITFQNGTAAELTQLQYQTIGMVTYVAFLFWAAALGGTGAIAFIGMNALAVQDDATFDIANEKFIGLRVVVGALFGVVLTLPFGFQAFDDFLFTIFSFSRDRPTTEIITNSILLLTPFILGFSTTVVIMILNQLVDGVQVFFGKKTGVAGSDAAAAAAASSARPTSGVNSGQP
jgi:hypothetical protein